MADDDDFGKDLAAAFEADEATGVPPSTDLPKADPPADDPNKKPEEPTPQAPEAPKEDPKKDDPAKPKDPEKPEAPTPPTGDEKKPEEGAKPPEAPKPTEPATPSEEPKPLTKEDVTSIIGNMRTEERASGKALETTTEEVLNAYYPDGLSNVLVDEASGKELRTPADVVAASNDQMSIEEATQWLLNEQFRVDQAVDKIKADARTVAETTLNFKRDGEAALVKYEPLFKWQPTLQKKVFDLMMKQVKADTEKGVILQAPDVMDLYDTYLEPYQKAFEFSKGQPATNPVPEQKPPEAKPGTDDRLDEGGDGGASPVDDPNDFAQQVGKELAKGM